MINLPKEDGQTYSVSNGDLIFVSNKRFKIDFDKVNSIDDIKTILKALNPEIHWYQKDCPEKFKEIYESGFLIEVK